MVGFSSLLLGLLAALLIAAAVWDIRARTIPNWLNLTVALLALPFWLSTGLAWWPGIPLQLLSALIIGGVFVALFAFGLMGGGDVKLLGALALWLPVGSMLALLLIMSFAGGIITIVLWARHRVRKPGHALEIPYGVAIAFGGLWLISERFLNQFG